MSSSSSSSSSGSCTIHVHEIPESGAGPLVLAFPQGPPPEGSLSFEYQAGVRTKHSRQRRLLADSEAASYEAQNFGADVQQGVYK